MVGPRLLYVTSSLYALTCLFEMTKGGKCECVVGLNSKGHVSTYVRGMDMSSNYG